MRVGLADDSELFRGGLAALLKASGIDVVLQVASGQELLAAVAPSGLDAAVVDIRMPPTFTEEGLDTADELGQSHPDVAVLVLSTYAETAYAARVFYQGAARRGYLLKDALDHPVTLRDALERLRAGGSVLDPSIVERLMRGTRNKAVLGSLTSQQRSLLHLVAQGYEDAEIAETMTCDESAARAEIDEALRALGIVVQDQSNRFVKLLSWLRSDPLT
jgi:DNA-binding NarL/FixJ family response regulator